VKAINPLRRAPGLPPPGVSPREFARWQVAHEGERAFWLGLSEADFQAHERGYRELAEQLEKRLPAFGVGADYRGLQIGCAVQDVIFFMHGGERYAVDPLADFYMEHFARSRDPGVTYRQALGESVPFPDAFFDFVLCQNVLDHVASCDAVLNEVRRVLRPPRLAYFGLDVYDEATAREREAKEARGEIADVEHPHSFTQLSFERMLTEFGFEILERWPPQPSGKNDGSWRHCLVARAGA